MQLSDCQISNALNCTSADLCIVKEQLDDVAFVPDQFFQATDRKHNTVGLIVPANNDSGWQVVDAVLLEKETV